MTVITVILLILFYRLDNLIHYFCSTLGCNMYNSCLFIYPVEDVQLTALESNRHSVTKSGLSTRILICKPHSKFDIILLLYYNTVHNNIHLNYKTPPLYMIEGGANNDGFPSNAYQYS